MREGELIAPRAASGAAAIRRANTPRDVALARALFLEYAKWLEVDLCFQGFEQELATLPGAYAPPRGRLLLAGVPGEAFACIALRPLDDGSGCSCSGAGAVAADGGAGEVKRLYVRPAHRGEGWGERLARTLVEEARAIGYRELKLDTLDWMKPARALYSALGFRECPPYYRNPLPGVVYMSLAL
jgi:ribosomal protein S18 acetylase RimI-like enzyme